MLSYASYGSLKNIDGNFVIPQLWLFTFYSKYITVLTWHMFFCTGVTSYVIAPYNEYPLLLGLLLKLLNGELEWSTRLEVLKVLGLVSALDFMKLYNAPVQIVMQYVFLPGFRDYGCIGPSCTQAKST